MKTIIGIMFIWGILISIVVCQYSYKKGYIAGKEHTPDSYWSGYEKGFKSGLTFEARMDSVKFEDWDVSGIEILPWEEKR